MPQRLPRTRRRSCRLLPKRRRRRRQRNAKRTMSRIAETRFCSKLLGVGRGFGIGSAHRAETVSLLRKRSTATESPFTSERGCVPWPPPCSPFKNGFGMKHASGNVNRFAAFESTRSCTPQRTQRSRFRSTPTYAADDRLKVSEASIQAQTFPRSGDLRQERECNRGSA